jgi:hypothetical protein
VTQEIKIEVDDHNFTIPELKAISRLAKTYPKQNIRVNDDPTNIKIYVGPYYKERFRFWVTPDGNCELVEFDSDQYDEEANWDSVGLSYAHDHLILDPVSEKG